MNWFTRKRDEKTALSEQANGEDILSHEKEVKFTDFDITKPVGRGSYGTVYEAIFRKSGQKVAMKKISFDTDTDAVVKEIKFLRNLRHDNIITYYTSILFDLNIFIIMEFCDGGSLKDIMVKLQNSFGENHIKCILNDTLKGINYLHTNKKIHRDIKAANIFVNQRGVCKLGDFGVSAELKGTIDKRKTMIGSPYWMSPEMIVSEGYDEKADIWSLGVVCFELAEGTPPYFNLPPVRAMFMIPKGETPTLTDEQSWGSEFKNFIRQCLTKDTESRPKADMLLNHPFVKKSHKKNNKSLLAFIQPTFAMPFKIKSDEDRTASIEKNMADTVVTNLTSTTATYGKHKKHKHYHAENDDNEEDEEEDDDQNSYESIQVDPNASNPNETSEVPEKDSTLVIKRKNRDRVITRPRKNKVQRRKSTIIVNTFDIEVLENASKDELYDALNALEQKEVDEHRLITEMYKNKRQVIELRLKKLTGNFKN